MTEREKIQQTIATLESQRAILGDDVVDASIQALQAQLQTLPPVTGESSVQTEDVGRSINTGKVKAGRDVIGGDQNLHFYGAPPPADARQAYLHYVCGKIVKAPSLAGIDPQAMTQAGKDQLQLDAVYTGLYTQSHEGMRWHERGNPKEENRLSAVAQLNRHHRLVLLGEPGSGKSTFSNFVALCMAGQLLGTEPNLTTLTAPLHQPDEAEAHKGDNDDPPQPQPWHHGGLLPALVVLRDFAATGLPTNPHEQGRASHLWDFITAMCEGASLTAYADALQREWRETGGLLLLDGLDEVPSANQRRAQLKQVVEDFAAAYPKVRLVVTSRTYAYQKQDWQLSGFGVVVLAPFDETQIRYFIDKWYVHVGDLRGWSDSHRQGQAALLKNAIERSKRLQELAPRPLLLTLMASLHAWRGGTLPEKREELYADTVELLLDRWEQAKIVRNEDGKRVVVEPSLLEWLQVDKERMRELLNRLAYEAHHSQPELVGTADIPRNDLVTGLLDLSHNPDAKPERLIEFLRDRAGLLVERGVGVYTFPHRTFQEYLAACHLTDDDFPDKLVGLAIADPNRWREVMLLAGAKAAKGASSTTWDLAEALCHQEPDEELVSNWGAHLAGHLLAEMGRMAEAPPRHQPKLARVKRWLVQIVEGETLPATERALAGQHLAKLGDTRPHLLNIEAMRFCYVPKGTFYMGSDEGDPQADDNEKPLHPLEIPYDYWLAEYPITNAQFAQFVAAGGYEQEGYWQEAIAAGRWQAKDGFRDWSDKPRRKPIHWGFPFDLANHPRVGVTWYEAMAFCRWLTNHWHDRLSEGWRITLPSEAEWEKAVRGGGQIPAEPIIRPMDELGDAVDIHWQENPLLKRLYPTSEELTIEQANFGDTGIGAISALGCFINHPSVYGCQEMAGNVFEWTRSNWGYEYPYVLGGEREDTMVGDDKNRVVRGGPWSFGKNWLRCSFRFRGYPNYRYSRNSFRAIVLSPFSETR